MIRPHAKAMRDVLTPTVYIRVCAALRQVRQTAVSSMLVQLRSWLQFLKRC